jgi:hypothetical protein
VCFLSSSVVVSVAVAVLMEEMKWKSIHENKQEPLKRQTVPHFFLLIVCEPNPSVDVLSISAVFKFNLFSSSEAR